MQIILPKPHKCASRPYTALRQDFFQSYPAEAVHYIEELPAEQSAEVLQSLPPALSASAWEILSPVIGARVLANLDDKAIKQVLSRIDPNKGALVLSSLADEDRKHCLGLLSPHAVQDFEQALSHEPDSAGALMNTRVVYDGDFHNMNIYTGMIRYYTMVF